MEILFLKLFYFKDSISDIMVVNELTHELLITGTKNGLIEIWDPMFSEHSHEIQSKPKLITAAYLLSDLTRISSNRKCNQTLYQSVFLNIRNKELIFY